jgi:N-acetylglucosaminyldiphosphoundecaprenol N-acetyl-beta-D-mannosaminyltransferase
MARSILILFGLPLRPFTMDEMVRVCVESVHSRRRTLIGVVNAAKIIKTRRSDKLRDSLLKCDILIADGQSVVWASRILRKPLPERVAGIDLFEQLLHTADREGRSIYLLGAKSEVLDVLLQRIKVRFPGLFISGSHDGYFGAQDSDTVATDIRKSHPDMLFVGMPSPKKELFMAEYADRLDVPVLHGVGGSFDIFAGVTKRAPRSWRRMGLEWMYRLIQEPRRLGPRYMRTNGAFILLTLKELIRPQAPYAPGSGTRTSLSEPSNEQYL